ncbi:MULTISPECIES: helix-turn-helix transcriptional regulator [unclassified Variovorax]|uniref:helix-turn-helix transcriptional regulator n=1 Tax=unclassified Variovorax TaxID=663243 RepID=UPI0032E6917C
MNESAQAKRPSTDDVDTTDALVSLIDACYASVGDDGAWRRLLGHLCDVFHANIGLLVLMGEGQCDKAFYAAHNYSEGLAREYSERWWAHDAPLLRGIEQGLFRTGVARRASDVIPTSELCQTVYWREFMRRMPALYAMSGVISDGSTPGAPPPMFISLFRPEEAVDFSEADLRLFERLLPHLLRAFTLHWNQRSLREQLDVMRGGLDSLDFGVVFLDAALHIHHANRTVSRMASQPALARWMGGLPFETPRQGELAVLIRACAAGRGASLHMGANSRGGRGLVALAFALPQPLTTANGDLRNAQMLVLADPEHSNQAATQFVTNAFGLSRAEARLLPLLMAGQSPAQMASSLSIGLPTVRSHLASIFSKTRTGRQQELLNMLSALPHLQADH